MLNGFVQMHGLEILKRRILMGDIVAGWSSAKMKEALVEMLPYLTDLDIEEFIKMYKKELERRYEIRRKKDGS